jgi:hypothetical protein
MNQQEKERRRALVVFQVFIYGYLAIVIAVQLYMYAQRNW